MKNGGSLRGLPPPVGRPEGGGGRTRTRILKVFLVRIQLLRLCAGCQNIVLFIELTLLGGLTHEPHCNLRSDQGSSQIRYLADAYQLALNRRLNRALCGGLALLARR